MRPPAPLRGPGLRRAPAHGTASTSCVALYESWRYVTASNDCATAHQVQVVYQDGATGLCHALAPGTQTTVGEGYFGGHGHVDHLALCEPYEAQTGP